MTQKLIQDRYQAVLDRIQKHSPEGKAPQLIAVSKTVGADQIQALYDLGQRHFGENRYPTLLEKQAALAQTAPDIVWHFIGRVQTRQVKEFINQIDYLHALDRFDLAKESASSRSIYRVKRARQAMSLNKSLQPSSNLPLTIRLKSWVS